MRFLNREWDSSSFNTLIKEAKEIANNPKVKGYKSTSELHEALIKDDNK